MMTIEGLTAIGLAPPAEGIPPPQTVATGDPFANAFAAAMAASAGKTDASGVVSTASMPAGLLVDPDSTWLALLGTPVIEGAPLGQGAVEISRPDRSAEADIQDAMMASTLALAGLLGLERPVVGAPSEGSPTGANGDVTVLAGEAAASAPVVALKVAADDGEAPVVPTPKAGEGIQVPAPVNTSDLSVPKPEVGEGIEVPTPVDTSDRSVPKPEIAAANRAAVASVEASSSAPVALQAAGANEGIQPRRPVDRLADQVQAAEPHDRSEVASAWNRAGGWRADEVATNPPDGAVEAAVVEIVDESAVADPADDASTDGVDASTTGQANQAPTAQPRIEANAAAISTVETTVEAGDGEQLVRGLADTVHRATREGDSGLRLVLNPPELGHLDIRIEQSDRGVRIVVAADSAQAGDLIRQHLPALRLALEARDLRVDRIDVQSSNASSNLDDSGDQTQRRQDGDDEQPRWSSVAAMEQTEQQADGEAAPVTARERGGSGLLDLVA